MTERFYDFRFLIRGQVVDRFGEIDLPGDTTLHIQKTRDGRGWIVRSGPAQYNNTTPILEISNDSENVRPVSDRTTVLWTKCHGNKEDSTAHTSGDWIPADDVDYLLLQILESDLQILVDLNPIVQDLHPSDRGRYTNKRNLGFRNPSPVLSPLLSPHFQVDP